MRNTALAAVIAAVCAGCGAANEDPPKPPDAAKPRPEPHRWPRPARCAADAAPGCTAARGTILYIESKDPDGDGDAHFVLTSTDSVTAPGITVIDVERSLRPHPLPRVGDRVTAAGPVYRGSYGQRQIEATELHVAR